MKSISLAEIDRSNLEYWLRESIWLVVLGATIGIGLWWILGHGVGGTFGRDHAILLGAASATPFLLAPLIQVGHPGGIFAGYLVPAAMLLLVGVWCRAATGSERGRRPRWLPRCWQPG